jgi:hypothetical protein
LVPNLAPTTCVRGWEPNQEERWERKEGKEEGEEENEERGGTEERRKDKEGIEKMQ